MARPDVRAPARPRRYYDRSSGLTLILDEDDPVFASEESA